MTTDELNKERDSKGHRASELNTGVVYFRAGAGSLSMVQAWRASMLRLSQTRQKASLTENDNDQSLFNQAIIPAPLRPAPPHPAPPRPTPPCPIPTPSPPHPASPHLNNHSLF